MVERVLGELVGGQYVVVKVRVLVAVVPSVTQVVVTVPVEVIVMVPFEVGRGLI